MAGVFASMAVRSCQGALVDLEHIRSTCRSVFTDAVNGRLPGGDPFFGGGSVKTPGGERECRDLRRLNRLLEARRAASMEDIIRGVEEAAKAGARWRGSGVGETAGASRQLLASHAATSAAFEALEDCDEDAWIAVLPSQMEKDFLKSINHVYLALVGALQAYASDIAEYRTQ
jgi:hypothetical protein